MYTNGRKCVTQRDLTDAPSGNPNSNLKAIPNTLLKKKKNNNNK